MALTTHKIKRWVSRDGVLANKIVGIRLMESQVKLPEPEGCQAMIEKPAPSSEEDCHVGLVQEEKREHCH